MIRLGYKAQDYCQKYPGRYVSMRCQDWSPTEKKEVAMRKGIVDWKAVFAAAKKAGLKDYFVEMRPPAMRGERAVCPHDQLRHPNRNRPAPCRRNAVLWMICVP